MKVEDDIGKQLWCYVFSYKRKNVEMLLKSFILDQPFKHDINEIVAHVFKIVMLGGFQIFSRVQNRQTSVIQETTLSWDFFTHNSDLDNF